MGFEVDQDSQNEEIKKNVENGQYFKNSLDYYFFSFLSIVSTRNILLIFIIFTGVTSYNFAMIIKSSFPLKEKFDMVLFDKGDIGYKTILQKIEYPQAKSIEEQISTYLILKYVKQRENFDFLKLEYNDLKTKIRYIKNNSSTEEFSRYMSYLNKDNENSPLKYWEKDIKREIIIKDFRFIKEEVKISEMTMWEKIKHRLSEAREYINPQLASTLEVDYDVLIYENKKLKQKEGYQNKIEFYFSGIKNNNYSKELKIIINSYKIFKFNSKS